MGWSAAVALAGLPALLSSLCVVAVAETGGVPVLCEGRNRPSVEFLSGLGGVCLLAWTTVLDVFVWERSGVEWRQTLAVHPLDGAVGSHAGKEGLHAMAGRSGALSLGLLAGVVAARVGAPPPWVAAATLPCVVVATVVVRPFWLAEWVMSWGFVGAAHVQFPHVLVADVMTSCCLSMWQLISFGCYVILGAHRSDIARPFVFAAPFILRAVQCMRCMFDARMGGSTGWDVWQHASNGCKYATAILVVWTSTRYERLGDDDEFHATWRVVWISSCILKTIYCTWWDVVMDWGLFSQRRVGRRESSTWSGGSLGPGASIWRVVASAGNACARASWTLAISPRQSRGEWELLLACIELLRRAAWNVLRVEWEVISHTPGGGEGEDAAQRRPLLAESGV